MGSLHSVPSTTSVNSSDGPNNASKIRKSRRIIDKIRGSRQSSRSDLILIDEPQNLDPILWNLCDAQACKGGEEQDNSTADVGECKQKTISKGCVKLKS